MAVQRWRHAARGLIMLTGRYARQGGRIAPGYPPAIPLNRAPPAYAGPSALVGAIPVLCLYSCSYSTGLLALVQAFSTPMSVLFIT